MNNDMNAIEKAIQLVEKYKLINSRTDEIVSNFIKLQQKKEEEIFTTALRTTAIPPIKGEITKGKIKWRGIRIVQYNDGFKYTKWLEQRGKRISQRIVFTCEMSFKENE